LGDDKGSFNVGDVEIEMIDSRMNYEFLNLLATQTNGKYFDSDQYEELLNYLNRMNSSASKEKLIISEIRLWSDEWLLIIVILLFATEWFIRKRAGML
jgi:TnpA family transposase